MPDYKTMAFLSGIRLSMIIQPVAVCPLWIQLTNIQLNPHIAAKHINKTSHSDMLKIQKLSVQQQTLSRQFSSNEPNIPNTFMAQDPQANNSQNVPNFNHTNSSHKQNNSPSSVFKPDQCIVISINKGYATTQSFNPNRIRKEINHDYRPMIIEHITPNRYNSDFAKNMLATTHIRDRKTRYIRLIFSSSSSFRDKI